jgi:transposase-like protein
MPWKEISLMSLRTEFVTLAGQPGHNIAELCRRFGISRTTAYKWLARARAQEPLSDRSKRPHISPQRSQAALETQVVALRRQFPDWGGRKIARVLIRDHNLSVAPSTVTHILRRHGWLWSPTQPPSSPGPASSIFLMYPFLISYAISGHSEMFALRMVLRDVLLA